MRKVIVLTLFTLLIMLFSASFSHDENTFESYPNEVIISVQNLEEAQHLDKLYDIEFVNLSRFGIATYTINDDANIHKLIEAGFVFNNTSTSTMVGRPQRQTNDYYINEQYALAMLGIFDAWDITTGDALITVAIIDTGIDIYHEEFQHNLSDASYNAVTDEIGLHHVIDDHGHGTLVAGVIGAEKDNSVGIAGAAPTVEMLIIKANNEDADVYRDSAIIDGIYYAVENGADIINLSLGGYHTNQLMETAIDYAVNQGVYVVAAAGNDNNDDVFYPAGYSNVISVGSVNSNQTRSYFSNYGETITIAAPGSDILTTSLSSTYSYANGTSFAAPYISAVLALILSSDAHIDYDEGVFRLLNSQFNPISDFHGAGIANAFDAITPNLNRVDFKTNTDTILETQFIEDGALSTVPDAPVYEDLVFIDWYLDTSFTTVFDQDLPIYEDLTVYPRYEPAVLTVFLSITNESIETIYVDYGEVFEAALPEKDNHTFFGWYIDETFETRYEAGPVYEDLNLYGYFEPVVYYTVTLLFEDEVYEVYTIESGDYFDIIPEDKTGYQFEGFYLDEDFTEPFDDNVITDDLELYLRFEPEIYLVDLRIDDTLIATHEVPFGTVPEFETPEKENHTFMGWYIDEALTIRYQNTVITQDTTLYARFAETLYNVSYYFNEDLISFERIEVGESATALDLEIIGHDFLGWYLDDTFSTPYTNQPIEENTVLYAKTYQHTYSVIFKDYSGAIIDEQTVLGGDAAIVPEALVHPENNMFTYDFLGWDHNFDQVGEDMVLSPNYKKTFNPDVVALNRAKDTINIGEDWTDVGIIKHNEALAYQVRGAVDVNVPGRYVITYDVLYNGTVYYTLTRIVHVLDNEMPEITLNPGIATIWQDGQYVEAGATVSKGTLEIIGEVDVSTPGRYTIYYRVNYQDITVERTRIVHVLPHQTSEMRYIGPVIKREDDGYVA